MPVSARAHTTPRSSPPATLPGIMRHLPPPLAAAAVLVVSLVGGCSSCPSATPSTPRSGT
jgi:hypothetical protein